MYETSATYKTAITQPVRTSRITGNIWGILDINDSNVKAGSLYYDNQCITDDNDIGIGACYVGELGLEYKTTGQASWLYGKNMTVACQQLVSADTWENIPIGQFTITDKTTRTSGEYVKIIAYDNMARLDATIHPQTQRKTVLDMAKWCCQKCDVVFGGVVGNLTNTDVVVVYDPSFCSDAVSTYRDLLRLLCQLMCSFSTIGRDGKLYIHSMVSEPCATIETNMRTKTEFSETTLRIVGVKMTYVDPVSGKTYLYQFPEFPISGKVLDLQNPLLQFLDDDERQTVTNSIGTALLGLHYMPGRITTFGDPSIDIGDVVTLTGYIAGTGVNCMVTQNIWRHKGYQEIRSTADMDSGVIAVNPVRTDGSDYRYTIVENSYVRLDLYIGLFANITVPAEVEDLPVKAISPTCFADANVVSVIIPDSIERIE